MGYLAEELFPWMVVPFVVLLIMIATGPIFYEHFWHKHYPKIAVSLASVVVLYYLLLLNNTGGPIHAFFEYFQFIALLSALYTASGGILIDIDAESKPLANVLLLIAGAIIANVVGTTGASMLLIRPYIRLNKVRIKPYHIIFFIFMVSNIGGCLTPIGDPPLFLGFLKGVPFAWAITHNFLPWLLAISLCSIIFYVYDSKNKTVNPLFRHEIKDSYSNRTAISGGKNFLWLCLIIAAVFIDPNMEGFEWVPAINYHGQKFSFVREIIMLLSGFISFRFANQKAIKRNEFNFEPIREVGFIFIGIFGTMMPALEIVANYAAGEGSDLINHQVLYWGTGIVSGFLDNAPTYLSFLAAALAAQGGNINNIKEVIDFAYGTGGFNHSSIQLTAISVSAVFFGAMTYIGNGPNFMVKSIAEQVGIQMPAFFGYMIRYSIPILLPLLFIVWLVFFAFV